MMNRLMNQFAGLCALALAASFVPQQAVAQSIQLGNSDRDVMDVLAANGFTDGVIVKRGFTVIRAEACKGGTKFLVKVSILKKINSTTPIGRCGRGFSPQDAVRAMRQDGYRDIVAGPLNRNVVATGCLQGRKFELTFNRRGDLINRERQGRCGDVGLSVRDVTRLLNERGYDRVKFTDRELPRYVAEACSDRTRVRLTMNRRGDITRERQIGQCPGRVNPRNLAAVLKQQGLRRIEEIQVDRAPYMLRACRNSDRVEIIISRYGDLQSETKIGNCRQQQSAEQVAANLEKQGYDRINFLRRNRTPYLVEACSKNALLELTINRFGVIRDEKRVGRCATPMTLPQVETALADKGYYAADISRRNNGSFDVTACRNDDKVRFRINRFGEFGNERRTGTCQSQSARDILNTLRDRGAEDVQLFVEGCFRNNLYRWSFDQLGNRTGRERISRRCP